MELVEYVAIDTTPGAAGEALRSLLCRLKSDGAFSPGQMRVTLVRRLSTSEVIFGKFAPAECIWLEVRLDMTGEGEGEREGCAPVAAAASA